MNVRVGIRLLGCLLLVAAPFFASASWAQDNTGTKGIDSGNYNIQQSVEFGYRGNWVNGNQNNYDTFVNLGSGVRLFDYTLDMRSLDHRGVFFDNLNFSNFGYGGDPNNVTRLRIGKNRWYDFRGVFRRDKNFWNYNLLANPLNPTSFNPATPIVNSPHSLDLVRRMQDYNLTILPQSRLRFRLGYSHYRNEGPQSWTSDTSVITRLNRVDSSTMNAYRLGVDYTIVPRTTISYDQFLNYYKQDDTATDQNFLFQLTGAVPVDLGIIYTGTTPCAAPVTNPATTPPTVKANCSGLLSYSLAGRPRNFMPTERLGLRSSYFRNFEMTSSVAYSSSDNQIPDYNELSSGLSTRTATRATTSTGPANAKRVTVTADWSGIYSVTEKFRIEDSFAYNNWRIPGVWNAAVGNLFSVAPVPGGTFPSMLLPLAPAFSAATCPAPFTAATCPQHTSSSGADLELETNSRFLGQNSKTNTFELLYDFSKRFSARIGYLYENRVVADFFQAQDIAEVYFPGGPTGTALNFRLAARGDCALVGGVLPAKCTLQANGSIIAVGLDAIGLDTERNITEISTNAAVVGLTFRPMDTLRISGDFLFGYSDFALFRTSPRQVQQYKIHATYTPRSWMSIDGAMDLHENRDNVFQVNNLAHGRTYSFVTILSPNPKFTFDLGYSYNDIHSEALVCFAASGQPGLPTTPCPIAGSPVGLSANGFYNSLQHFAYSDVIFKPMKAITASVGYAGSFVGGSTLVLNPLQPLTALAFNYQKPYAMIQIDLYKGLSYKTTWNYYGYNGKAPSAITGLAPIGSQDFNGSLATFAVRYAF